MIVNLSDSHALASLVRRHGPAVAEPWTLGHPWRHLLLADLRPPHPPAEQARRLLLHHLDAAELRLRPGPWPALHEMPAGEWPGLASEAVTSGLAYGFWAGRRVGDAGVVREFLAESLLTLAKPCLLSNVSVREGTWAPVSEHTFDAVLIAHDASRLAVVLVVDED